MVKWSIINNKQLHISDIELKLILYKLCYNNKDCVLILFDIIKDVINKNNINFYINKNKPNRDFRFVKLKMWPIKHDIKHIGSKNFIQDIKNNKINKNPKLKDKINFINNCKMEKYERTRIYEMYLRGYNTYLLID